MSDQSALSTAAPNPSANDSSARGNIQKAYYDQLAIRGFAADVAQQAAVDRLQKMSDEFAVFVARRSNAIKRLFDRTAVPRGVWLWGGVGRGKSFLMDSFFNAVNVRRKTRIHFHEFMRSVHSQLHELRGMQDPLVEVAKQVAAKYRLICFDEFHVSDVADAMILHRLLEGLFANGCTFVMTSNYAPDKLYPDGLHRDRILPAIELLKAKLDVVTVDAGIDYRRRSLEQLDVYLVYEMDLQHDLARGVALGFDPLSATISTAKPDGWVPPLSLEQAQEKLNAAFTRIAEARDESPILQIEAREIVAKRRAGGVVWFDFGTLCGGPRSQNDYLEIASQFHTVILEGIPRMGPRQASEARRFTWLIDVLYDHKTKLIMAAECAPEDLYTEGPMANEFARTVSRIVEMQSKEYLQAQRRTSVRL